MIRYKCQMCGVDLESSESLGGNIDQCPLCKKWNHVPWTRTKKRKPAKTQPTIKRKPAKIQPTILEYLSAPMFSRYARKNYFENLEKRRNSTKFQFQYNTLKNKTISGKTIFWSTIAGLVLLGVILGDGVDDSTTPKPPSPTATTTKHAIDTVYGTFDSNNSVYEFQTGTLSNGTAVLVNDRAAYWIKDGKVYAANGAAKMLSPNIEYAPSGIDIDSVEEGVK